VEDILLGTANVFLQSLAYSLDFADEICIVDYKVRIQYEKKRKEFVLFFEIFRV
jgi:hypothetical protein